MRWRDWRHSACRREDLTAEVAEQDEACLNGEKRRVIRREDYRLIGEKPQVCGSRGRHGIRLLAIRRGGIAGEDTSVVCVVAMQMNRRVCGLQAIVDFEGAVAEPREQFAVWVVRLGMSATSVCKRR